MNYIKNTRPNDKNITHIVKPIENDSTNSYVTHLDNIKLTVSQFGFSVDGKYNNENSLSTAESVFKALDDMLKDLNSRVNSLSSGIKKVTWEDWGVTVNDVFNKSKTIELTVGNKVPFNLGRINIILNGGNNPEPITNQATIYSTYIKDNTGITGNGNNYYVSFSEPISKTYSIYVDGYGDVEGPTINFKAKNVLTIEYRANLGNSAPSTQQFDEGTEVTIQPVLKSDTPTRNPDTDHTYNFLGWSENANDNTATYKAGDKITPNRSLVLFAIFEKIDKVYHTISYNLNNGNESINSGSVKDNEDYRIDNTIPTRNESTDSYYDFNGWHSSFNGKIYQPNDKINNVTSNITLTAIWNPVNKYTVTFNNNGGTGGPGSKSVRAGESINIASLSRPSRTGYTFEGWATTSTATVANNDFKSNYTPQDNITLYAVWKEIEVIKYYWYVGQSDPTKMTSISPIVNDKTSSGWREIGTSVPTYTMSNPLWDGQVDEIVFDNYNDVEAYIALPDSTIKVRDGLGNDATIYMISKGTVDIKGVRYTVYQNSSIVMTYSLNGLVY